MPRKSTYTKEPARQIYQISADDLEIFKLGSTNVNYLTDHYVRTPTSGTYWQHRDENDQNFDPERELVWQMMRHDWIMEGRPEKQYVWQPPPDLRFFLMFGGAIKFNIQWDDNHEPKFWHHHGWLLQPWQLVAHHAAQPDVTIIGGFGCGKTSLIAMSLAMMAITIPNFRGFAIAPQMLQAMEVYTYLNTTLKGTPYWDNFVWNNPQRPWPKLIVRNSFVGESTIEIFSIEHDPEKIRTLEGDVAFLDQAEKFDELEDIQRDLGTRLRGAVKGRPRLGKMTWIANAGDNPMLWERFDMGEYQPKNYLSLNPRSTDNPYLSTKDLANLRRRVGGTEEEVEQWMEGRRPMGSGEHFTRKMVEEATNDEINKLLEYQTSLPATDPRRIDGFVMKRTQQLGIYHYEIPPDHLAKRDYIVISDPGSGNPPDRNTPVIGVFDVTEFPQKRMKMVAFEWVFGNGSYWPWALAYQRYVETYRAYGRNAFDSTGVQKGFDELIFSEMGLAAEGMNMAVSGKMMCLNALKFFMGKGLIEIPYIAYMSNQLTNYRLPDNKIRQDLVMMLSMAASWARRLYYVDLDSDDAPSDDPRELERHDRLGGDRHSRLANRNR
jgi:hypothetical protein